MDQAGSTLTLLGEGTDDMKSGLWFGVGVLATLVVVAALLLGGWLLWHNRAWGVPMQVGQGMMDWQSSDPDCAGPARGRSRGQQDDGSFSCQLSSDPSGVCSQIPLSGRSGMGVQGLPGGIGHGDLLVTEVMEFDQNFYAIAQEPDTQMGAMELLLDRATGKVSPEIGPNMIWNTKYGMHGSRGMMRGGRPSGDSLTESDVLRIAQAWLDENRSGETSEDADPFYGYYTVHTERDGELTGMLSVHGTTGQVWYHTWLGEFVRMTEHEADASTC